MNTIHGRMREAEAERLGAEMTAIARAIHYPECWDTAAYPTLAEALDEMYAWFECSDDDCQSDLVALPRTVTTDLCEKVSEIANGMRGGPTLTNIYAAWVQALTQTPNA